MTEKVLVHDGAPTEVHLVSKPFIAATHTICGERLHPICCVRVDNDAIPVTCEKCKEKLS